MTRKERIKRIKRIIYEESYQRMIVRKQALERRTRKERIIYEESYKRIIVRK